MSAPRPRFLRALSAPRDRRLLSQCPTLGQFLVFQETNHSQGQTYVSLKIVCIVETESSGTVGRPDQIRLSFRIGDSD